MNKLLLALHNVYQGGLAATFDLSAFLVSMIAPVKKSVNHSRTVTSMRTTQRSGFAFDSITFYSLLAIFNDSSQAIRTKGIQDQLWAIFLASVVAFLVAWRDFSVSGRKRS